MSIEQMLAVVADTARAAPVVPHWTEYARLGVSILGFAGTISIIVLGLRQYRRGEQWKRGEFVANEIKEFENHPTVRTVYAAIDWSERRINLSGNPDAHESTWTPVTREFLWRSLLPHGVNARHPKWQAGQMSGKAVSEATPDVAGWRGTFTRDAAQARDAFDVFFDRLGRFGNFIEARLITGPEVWPYLGYWLTGLASRDGSQEDSRWRCTALTYLFVYRFQGAITLFMACGYDLNPDGPLYQGLREPMRDDELFNELHAEARTTSAELLHVARQAIH